MCPHIHIGLGKEVRRAEKKAIWAFKEFDNDAYIENFLVNIPGNAVIRQYIQTFYRVC